MECPECGGTAEPLMISEPQRGSMADLYDQWRDVILWYCYCGTCGTFLEESLVPA
jgi:hypothetical protein